MVDLAEGLEIDTGPQTVEAEVFAAELIQAMYLKYAVFLDFFMHEHIDGEAPEFHHRVWKLMTDIAKKLVVIAIPRGHAKTTLAKLSAVWYFLFTPIQFIVYVGNTADSAISSVKDIMDHFDNVNFIKLFGRIRYETEKRGEGEFIFYIDTPFHGTKRCILKARGCGQQLRGLNIGNFRPQLAIVDDLEDIKDLQNEDIRNFNKKWFFGTFIKALDRRYRKVVFIGNLLDRNCILKQAIDSPIWFSMVLGAILKNGQPLWPDMWSITDLVADYQEYQRLGLTALWFAEMMNLIIAAENAVIQSDEIVYFDQPEIGVCRHGFITIDPGTGTGNDNTAIVLHLLLPTITKNMIPMIADYRFGQFDEKVTVDIALAMALEWGVRVIGIESIAYQRALATLFEIICMQRGLVGFQIVKTYPANVSKSERIRAWAALLKSKGYFLTKGDLHITNQLIGYDVTKKENDDDLIDACAQGPEMLKSYLGLIMSVNLMAQIAAIHPKREASFY